MKTRVKKEFRVVHVGTFANLFNLRSYVLLATTGECYEVSRSDGIYKKPWTQGQDIAVDVDIEDGEEAILWGYVNVQEVKRLPNAPKREVEEALSDES